MTRGAGGCEMFLSFLLLRQEDEQIQGRRLPALCEFPFQKQRGLLVPHRRISWHKIEVHRRREVELGE